MDSRGRVKPRILFVEDEDSISEPFTRSLEKAGFEPVNARTSASALELFQIKPLAEPARCYRRCYRRLVRRCHWRGGRKYCGRWHSRGVYCRRRCY